MYKVTVRSVITNKNLRKVLRFVSEIVILNRKIVGREQHTVSKVILKTDIPKAVRALRSVPNLKKFSYETVDSKTLLLNHVVAHKPPTTAFFEDSKCGCCVESMRAKDNILTQTILTPNKACFEKGLRKFEAHNKVISVDYKKAVLGELTLKQHQILRQAYELGYFDFPKKVNLKKLSELFGVSTAAVLETLRSAERKVIQGHLK